MSLTPKRSATHGRSPSGRVALARRMTKGPLDADDNLVHDDPLDSTSTNTSSTTTPVVSRSPQPSTSPQPPITTTTTTPTIHDPPSLDVSFLQDPSAYHPLPTTNTPLPFQHSPTAPSPSTPLASLLATGHYRLAATAATRHILSAAPRDHPTLFHLVHVRLACLCLLNEHALAAQEAKILGDLGSAFYRHPVTGVHLVPWALRVLVVRLSALGYGEWRKGIMGYYELARECRESILRAQSDEEKSLWRSRLRDCGVRVANTLVEMGDLEGAGRHLDTLASLSQDEDESREILLMETLVWLRVGDLESARRCLASATTSTDISTETSSSTPTSTDPSTTDSLTHGTLTALLDLASTSYDAATTAFQTLHAQHPTDAMLTQNLAVSLLYTGRIAEAKTLLVDLLDNTPPFHALLVNLSTVFELCTERSRERKVEVAEMLAQRRDGGGVGWERGVVEFKL